MDERTETKLLEVIDRQEIWQVLQHYARGLDRLDRALVRSCYFDDAVEDHDKFVGGPDQFIDWADRSTLGFAKTHHGLLNHYCELAGDDAYAETYFLFIGTASEPPHFMATGRYVDHFQKRRGEWRIANRIALVEGQFAIDDASQLAATAPSSYPPEQAQPSTRDRRDASYQRPPRPRLPRPLSLS